MLTSHLISAKDPYNSQDEIIYKLETLEKKQEAAKTLNHEMGVGGQET